MCSCYGKIKLIDYHNERLNRTRRELFGCKDTIDLKMFVHPDEEGECIKVRVVYDRHGITEISYTPYSPKDIRTLKFVTCNDIEYTYKSTDRTRLSELASNKGNCDEVLIVKNGLITDTSYTNVAVLINDKWLTPRSPLLKGTRRASLLDNGIIIEGDIHPEDITAETDVMLFNGMMDFGTHTAHVSL